MSKVLMFTLSRQARLSHPKACLAADFATNHDLCAGVLVEKHDPEQAYKLHRTVIQTAKFSASQSRLVCVVTNAQRPRTCLSPTTCDTDCMAGVEAVTGLAAHQYIPMHAAVSTAVVRGL